MCFVLFVFQLTDPATTVVVPKATRAFTQRTTLCPSVSHRVWSRARERKHQMTVRPRKRTAYFVKTGTRLDILGR